MLADYRLISDIIPADSVEYNGDKLFIDGKYFGRTIPFIERFSRHKVELIKAENFRL